MFSFFLSFPKIYCHLILFFFQRSERRTSLDQAKPTDASSSTVSTSSGASLNPGRFSQRRRATSTPLTETSFFTPMTSTALEVVQEQPEVAEHN